MELSAGLFKRFRFRRRAMSAQPSQQEDVGQTYGTFMGVYLPSSLAIFGVIMYLRLGMVVGKVGIVPTLTIIGLSSLITLLAALSIASITTNMKVNKGGAYYIVSRSLGIDFGSAIGIPLYLGQAIGLAFFVLGFAETVHALYPACEIKTVSLITLVGLGMLGFLSTRFVLKTQLVIFAVIFASLISLFLGKKVIESSTVTEISTRMSYWAAFAIFFPAMTGIEAGMSMSGVLKNPRRSLPIGTLAAAFSGLIVYLLLALFLWYRVPCNVLAINNMICQEIARWSFLIIAGIWGATLSSAVGAILAAPRTLQALAEDGIVFRFLSKEHGKHAEPRMATFFTLLLSTVFVIIGDINLIAPILTMFFLISYGMLNLVCGLEAVMGNPSWRPTFKIPAWASFGGALLCLLAMLMIDAGATIVALSFVFLIYFFRGRKLSSNWDDIRFGILMLFIKKTVYRLKSAGFAARSWRPHLLIFSPSVTPPAYLMNFSSKLTRGGSFLTFANIIEANSPYSTDTVEKVVSSSLKKYKMHGFVSVDKAENIAEGYKRLIVAHGIGPLTHNTVILMHASSNGHEYDLYPEIIQRSYEAGKNILVLKMQEEASVPDQEIDIWWDSSNRKSSELILVLAHMYQSTQGIKKSNITIKSLVNSETAREQRLNYFVDLFSKSRLSLSYKVYVGSDEERFKLMNHFSGEADLTFIGLPAPKADQEPSEYREVYSQYVKNLKNLKKVALTVAAEPVNFQEIFR